jgi:hypothetical protein
VVSNSSNSGNKNSIPQQCWGLKKRKKTASQKDWGALKVKAKAEETVVLTLFL